ncbi:MULTISPECIES: DUF4355 domain-containing protein [Bacillus]|uniref:Uncharacterized protein n=2 Tax=Bacillus velezensis TaxID=492670 RepID=A0A411A4U9_BACVE|nr:MULTISPECIES: DUF4355 domain-containing protein [Bacillus]AFJ61284.1 putative ribonuclease phage related protein [Bacillus velezensis YAU B9601-Y2]APA02241.1 hypothetical protein BK055_06710 [Bacillus velezensis]ARW38447.1 hypothetical protein S101267_01359 [Bacillus amyloliquefaciens]ASB64865.1 hypothetical protein S101413_01418 [Bacillus velezensis]AVB10870.1 DUF4355 domain-containing protein [Bacillus velezensis]
MDLKTVKEFLEQNKEKEEVKSYLEELSAVSADKVSGFLDTDEGKKILQPRLDEHFSKSLNTWKTNNLQKHVDEKVKELYPEKDPLELKVANLEKQLAMKEMRSFAMDKAHKEGLPLELVDLVMGEDQEKTSSNLDLLKGVFSQHIENKTQERLKADGIDPKGSQEPPKTFTMEQLKNMSEEEYIKNQEAVDAYLNSQSN